MANCIIIHGCPDNIPSEKDEQTRTYNKHWIKWLKAQLEGQGVQAMTPAMPKPWAPDYQAYAAEFEKLEVTKDTVLVGHSCGCAFLVRWLGESKRKIKKLVLVAPWKIPDGLDESRVKFYTYEIEPGIKDRVGSVTVFTSDDEEPDGQKSAEIFHQELGGRLTTLAKHGHYTLDDMGTDEFPELLAEVNANV
jgi:predicted alpha/beta hydrolase family esterase